MKGGDGSWLVRTAAVEGSGLTRTRWGEDGRSTGGRDTKVSFWALYAVLYLLRWRLWPAAGALSAKGWIRPRRCLRRFRQGVAVTADGMDRGTRRCRNSDTIRVILETAFYSVTGRKEGVEALDQVGMASE